jgi:SAM-dependent methyltransferase
MNEMIKPTIYNQNILFLIGLFLRTINKVRHTLIGYKTARTFSPDKVEKSVTYCLNVVKNWEKALINYTGNLSPFTSKNIIELGPGPDLGTGIIMLASGSKSYTAVDKNKLINSTPPVFYNILLSRLKELPGYEKAKNAVDNILEQRFDEDFCYIHDSSFNLESVPDKKYDILVSQAVLEHITDINKVFEILSHKLRPNSIMVNEVDLGTHTALIRDLDPLNLLRYSDSVWNLLKFDGSPNRLRAADYRNILKQLGFTKINICKLKVLVEEYVERLKPYLSNRFKNYSDEDVGIKSFYLLATKEK